LICLVPPIATGSGGRIGPRLEEALARPVTTSLPVWIFFDGKDERDLLMLQDASALVSPRSLHRRSRAGLSGSLVDFTDLPVSRRNIEAVKEVGIRIRQVSKWLNAMSIEVDPGRIHELARMTQVRHIELVHRFRRDRLSELTPNHSHDATLPRISGSGLDYGFSLPQLERIAVPPLHEQGNFGQGVLVGVFDNGFRLLSHEAFDSLDIVATYDFVEHKVDVTPSHPTYGGHGINTLSVIGGYAPGWVIGPAFQASYILARTENDSSETPLEEDNWVAAIEWADSIGVEVTSTSLVYRGYDSPYPSWTWEDMDGGTTLITRAADMAAAKGIIVVNSAGNNGPSLVPGQNTLGAPADGDSVIAVGALDQQGVRAGFSSVGPTTDNPPRVKPDVMAPGVAVWCASAFDPVGYTNTFQGTSFACPLVAGVAALLLQANPDATPADVISAMRQTASQAGAPDNLNGWGTLNATAAHNLLQAGGEIPTAIMLRQNYPNPFNSSTTLQVDLPVAGSVRWEIFDVLGRLVRTFSETPAGPGTHLVVWDGRNGNGIRLSSGVYIFRALVTTATGTLDLNGKTVLVR
jgi:subtilisin family serine protease